jgi:hypothetical protein
MTARRLLGSVALAFLCLCVPARAVSNGDGDLIVSFRGGIEPKRLPREEPAPVAVRVEGNVKSASGNVDQLPQLRRIVVAINREGVLDDRGLPICRASRIQPASERAARHICGSALIGSGQVTVQVRIPSQGNFFVHASLLAFNGPRRNGHKLILAQAYARKPPGSFILVFRVSRGTGTYGTVLSTTLPAAAQKWAYLTHFDMTLHRTFTAGGERHSYVSAACGAPAGLNKVLFPFARATYSFDSGQKLTMSESGTCRVAE